MPTSEPSNLLQFFGHFHPLVVHLPIGFLTLLAIVELAGRTRRFNKVGHSRGIILALTAGAAVVSVTFGLMLASGGEGYDPQLLFWHKWMGIGLAIACLLTAIFYWRGQHRIYTGLLMITLAVMAPASHFGGSMTHGKDYLTEYAPDFVKRLLGEAPPPAASTQPQRPKVTDPQQAIVFDDLVQPVFQQDCMSCHSAEKLKGNFRVDNIEGLMKGGQSGPGIMPGKSADSTIVQRMLLPESDPKHMPPAGKTQPTDDQLALVQWWIDSGAKADKKVAESDPPTKVLAILDDMFAPAQKAPDAKPIAEIQSIIDQLAAQTGVVIVPLSQDQPWVSVNASVARSFGDADLATLAPIAANIQSLDLASTKITNAGLAALESMTNLTHVHLERTAVTDAGLAHLAKLRKLQYINLYGDNVTDAGLVYLKGLTNLHHLYLWQTKVTPDAAKTLADGMTDKQKIARWQQDIDALQAKIKSQGLDVVESTRQVIVPTTAPTTVPAPAKPAAAAPAATPTVATAAPINTTCPITGLAIDPIKIALYDGKTIAFCCDKCLAKFKKNPNPVLAKLQLAAAPAKTDKKP
jgi:uncharacterized membrane protein/YHS domain-containing protein